MVGIWEGGRGEEESESGKILYGVTGCVCSPMVEFMMVHNLLVVVKRERLDTFFSYFELPWFRNVAIVIVPTRKIHS